MLNKLNTKTLLVLLVALVALVAVVFMSKENTPKSTLPAHIVDVDSSAINRLVINPTNHGSYELLRKNGVWKLKLQDGRLVPVENRALNNSFSSLINEEPKRIITRKEEKWAAYELTDSLATKVSFYEGETLSAAILIGKVDFNQQTSTMSNFVRIEGQNEVFLCNAPLTFDWNKKAVDWRNKNIFSVNSGTITKVSASGLREFTLVKDDLSGWVAQGINLDSAQIDTYIDGISNLKTQDFADDVLIADLPTPFQTFEVYTELSDVSISLYQLGNQKLVTSASNPSNVFILSQDIEEKLLPKLETEELLEN